MPITCSIFLTHTHWDHIQGLPFFVPFFVPKNLIHVYGAFDPVAERSIKDVLGGQMEYCYFPVSQAELKADVRYTTLRERQPVEIGSATVTNILMNHPVLCYGYRIDCGGKSLFFTGDNEPPANIYEPNDDYYEEYEGLLAGKMSMLHDFIRGVDVLITDSTYTPQEYQAKKGWGHGTFDSGIALARAAGAKALYLTHHEPLRSDSELDDISRLLHEQYPAGPGTPPFTIASEGLEIIL
ncbi:MAG: MBL fold metallo-hydrolase [Nitrospirae bacterium]|nr:MBL fold metallo-hydrolase [Nitrospirota bacterium]